MNALAERAIAQQEHHIGVPLDYLRTLADTSTRLFLKFGLTTPVAGHRRHAPREAWHLARLGATHVQDCGTCVQIVVNLALRDGMAPELLRAALAADADRLGATEHDALRFGVAVASRDEEAVRALRDRLSRALGDEAVVELAVAVALVQIYPLLKRGLGQTVACSLVHIDVSAGAVQ